MTGKLRMFDSEGLTIELVAPAAAGKFTLTTPINPAHCPACGKRVKRIWHFHPAADPARALVVACDTCVEAPS